MSAAREGIGQEAREIAAWFNRIFGDRYFIEIMNNGVEVQRLQLQAAVDVALRLGIPLVATSDAHYVRQEDAVAQDVLLCINTGKFRTDTNRMRMENDTFYLRSPEEMYSHFPGLEDAVRRHSVGWLVLFEVAGKETMYPPEVVEWFARPPREVAVRRVSRFRDGVIYQLGKGT